MQTTNNIMMVRPKHFGFNEITAENNAFQVKDDRLSPAEIKAEAQREFDNFVKKLRDHGVNIYVMEDTDTPITPDAVFPNNWVSFHDTGMVMTYPMYATNRRTERREDIIDTLGNDFKVEERFDLSAYENQNIFLEGTGSMILDRENKIVYACVSERTDGNLLDIFCTMMGYEKEEFHATDEKGQSIYHTNVMMAVGDRFAVVCFDCIEEDGQANALYRRLIDSGKAIIEISRKQMNAFAGNMLQVRNNAGNTYLVMSEQAYKSLAPTQIDLIQKYTEILHSPLYTIEQYGGGSARCMMAEIFLKVK